MSKSTKKKLDGLTFEELRRQIKERRLDPLYLLTGAEEYLHDRTLKQFYGTLDDAGRLFNVSLFTIGSEVATGGAKATAAMAIDAANQMPMMAERRIIVIRDFDKIREEEQERLFDYLKRPAPTATVIFQSPSLDQRRKITAALLKHCTVVVLEQLNDQQAMRWAEQFLKNRNCSIDPNALGQLIGLVGTKLMRLANELEKLAAYAGGGIINHSTVDLLIPRAREHTSFELWDAILERDRKRALRLVDRLLKDGTEPVMIVGALGGLYRRLLAAKDLMVRGAPSAEVMKATGQYGNRAKFFHARVLRTPREEIVHGIRRLSEVDRAIKNSEATPRLQIEFLVSELTLPDSYRWGIFH